VHDDMPPPDDMAGGQEAQHDAAAEQSLLGSMMLSKQAVWDVVAVLAPTDFWDPRHEEIARTIVGLAHANRPTDQITVVEELTKAGSLSRVGGAAYVWSLTDHVLTAANATFYADIVLERSLRRKLLHAGTAIVQVARGGTGDIFEHVESARAHVDAVTRSAKIDVKPVGDSLASLIDSLSQKPRYVATPWADLNDYIGGLRPGALYVVGARPAAGKTILGLQMAVRLAKEGTVAIASLEMSEADLQKRLISQFGDVHMSGLMNGSLTKPDWEAIARVREQLARAPIFIDDRSGMNITQIKAFARSTARKGKLAGVVVDYLQLITSRDSSKPRHEVVAEFSRELKIMARELDVPVVALSQLNRGSEARTSKTPQLSDLRESGAIEQDADVVMLLSRDPSVKAKADLLEVVVAKNRHGKTGKLELLWEGHYARVRSIETVWSPTATAHQPEPSLI